MRKKYLRDLKTFLEVLKQKKHWRQSHAVNNNAEQAEIFLKCFYFHFGKPC